MNVANIRARCIQHDDGCLEWPTKAKTVRVRHNPMANINGNAGALVRRELFNFEVRPLKRTQFLRPKCVSEWCIEPQHQRVLSIKESAALGGKSGAKHRDAKVAATRRARGRNKLTDEQVQEIRASQESGYALAKRLNVDEKTISNARKGQTYRDYSSPFAGLGARR